MRLVLHWSVPRRSTFGAIEQSDMLDFRGVCTNELRVILVNAERKCLTLVPYPHFSDNFRDKLAKSRRLRRTNLRSGNTSRSDSAWRRSPHESLNFINPRLTSLGFPRNTVLPHIHWIWPFLFRYPGLVESRSEAVSAMRVMFVQPRARGEKQTMQDDI